MPSTSNRQMVFLTGRWSSAGMTDAATAAIVYVMYVRCDKRTTSDGVALVFVCDSGVKLLQLFESRSRFNEGPGHVAGCGEGAGALGLFRVCSIFFLACDSLFSLYTAISINKDRWLQSFSSFCPTWCASCKLGDSASNTTGCTLDLDNGQ